MRTGGRKNMVKLGQKFLLVTILIALFLGIAESRKLEISEDEPASNSQNLKSVSIARSGPSMPPPRPVFKMTRRGPVPPSGPSKPPPPHTGANVDRSGPSVHPPKAMIRPKFGKYPRGTLIPPSGPSRRTSPEEPRHPPFVMYPKDTPTPPSGPSLLPPPPPPLPPTIQI